MDNTFYQNKLYPFQDKILKIITGINTGFYLSGGTAASRGYLNHRFSDDLDFFVNDNELFSLWVDQVVYHLRKLTECKLEIIQREERFGRINLIEENIVLKIEMINDVPSYTGAIKEHEILGKIDNPQNILSNKISALIDRNEPKDIADIWGFVAKMGLSLKEAITNADNKASGIFPADLARLLCCSTREDWEVIRWINKPDCQSYLKDLRKIGESLIINP